MTESTLRIIEAVRAVPPGKVSCYRDIARVAGLPNGARQVVRILHSMTEKYGLPWHRIIRADGTIALDSCQGGDLQATLLRSEGVAVSKNGKVDMNRYGNGSGPP
ncbi:MAG: MGMT family protein [Spirochaetaceae bacterium]|jgi:methylated-DNA-protein-cysteine methyltransferase-like protein|nr:MGMT family protein [Spirochaetaceae bacterium]